MVLPLWDENPFKSPSKPVVNWVIILINIALYLCQVGGTEDLSSTWALAYGAIPAAVLHLDPVAVGMQSTYAPWLRPELTVITSIFLHADLGRLQPRR
jgi:membrane associated rhomboid family serine protease